MEKRLFGAMTLLLWFTTCCTVSSFAQPWADLMTKGDKASFEAAKAQFKTDWKNKKPEKGKGFKPFMRWKYYWENRLMPDGSLPKAGTNEQEFSNYQKSHGFTPDVVTSSLASTGNWKPLGPTSPYGGFSGVGRINAIAFDPGNSSVIYVGSAGGGVWKTTNGGTSWTPLTDFSPSLGVSSILVDPASPNTIYVATGDGNGGDSPSLGILKSTNGGATWSTTGLNWAGSNLRYTRKLVKNSTGGRILVATSIGIWYTDNAGASWTQANTGAFNDLEKMPGSTGTFYATAVNGTTAQVFRSTNNGVTWTQVHSLANSNRAELAVSASNPNFVGVLYSNASDSGFNGFYSSVNGGTAWTLKSSTPNLLGWEPTGSDEGGQGWYDLTLAVSPSNANTIYVGGVNTWKSTNGGTTWTINTVWTPYGTTPVVHADKHVMEFQNSNTLFEGNDGGIYKTTNGGASWTDLTNTMAISQMYRLGVSQATNAIICGLQDNGTKLRRSTGNWIDELGGDGMDCAINPINGSFMYAEFYNGDIYRSTNSGSTWASIKPNTDEQGAWVTPFALAPSVPATMYIGYQSIYKSTNGGTSWTRMGLNSSTGPSVRSIAVAPNNANIVYYAFDADLSTGSMLRKTINGGTSWTTLTNPTTAGYVNAFAIDNTNANNVWVCVSGYNSGRKVYRSTNGGSTWTNISGTLPNIPANTLVYSNNTNGGVYLGMDVGVYYRSDAMSDWVLFKAQLPNVEITDLEIQNSMGKLRAATYGRGVWESDLYGITPFIAREEAGKFSDKELQKTNFKVYPNPAQDILNVEFYAAEAGASSLYILDLMGRVQTKEQVVEMVQGYNKVNIQINDLPNGVYYLTNGKGKSVRFVKTASSSN